MITKKNLVLITLVIVLLALLFAVTMIEDKPNTDTSNSENSEETILGSIFEFNTDTVNSILVNTSGERFLLAKNGDSWIMPENINASISSASVNMLCSLIGNISYTDVITDGSLNRQDCGINENSDYITFKSELGEVTLTKGMTTTDGKLCYVVTSLSDKIYFAKESDVANIFAPLATYRNGISLRVDFDNLDTITYSGLETFSLKKGDANTDIGIYNQWKITTPVSIGANDEEVNKKIIEPLKTIKIQSFASDNGNFSDFGMDGKTKYIILTDTDGKKQTVYFSNQTNGKYYISVDDNKTIYEVLSSDAPFVSIGTIDVANRNLNLAKMADLSSVTLKGKDVNYTIEFLEDGGMINGTKVSSDTMNRTVFTSVCGLMADDIYTGSTKDEEIEIKYNYKNKSSDTLSFSSFNDRYFSVSKNGTTKYLILKTKLNDLVKLLDSQI